MASVECMLTEDALREAIAGWSSPCKLVIGPDLQYSATKLCAPMMVSDDGSTWAERPPLVPIPWEVEHGALGWRLTPA